MLGADLSGANLSGAEGVTKEILEQRATSLSLQGATMPDGTVRPERYVTREFEPALSFTLSDEEWKLNVPETPNLISFGEPGARRIRRIRLNFTSPVHVFDPSNPSERIEVPAPDNAAEWGSWFQKHPNLDTSELDPMSVGGKSGVGIDVIATPENSSSVYCGGVPCVFLFTAGGASMVSYGLTKDRFIIVDDVEGETVIIHASAPTATGTTFNEVLQRSQKVIDSVEWKGK